jgi:hypothetical protein
MMGPRNRASEAFQRDRVGTGDSDSVIGLHGGIWVTIADGPCR